MAAAFHTHGSAAVFRGNGAYFYQYPFGCFVRHIQLSRMFRGGYGCSGQALYKVSALPERVQYISFQLVMADYGLRCQ